MFCRDTDSPEVSLDNLIAPFQPVAYKSEAMQTKPTASVYGLLLLTPHTSIAVKIKPESFVVIIRKECFDLRANLHRQKPRRKKEQPSFEGLCFILAHAHSSDHFSLIHWVTFIECSLNGNAAHVRVDLSAFNACVPKHLLNNPNVRSIVNEMGCKSVAQDVWMDIQTNPQAYLLDN